jgi:DNA-binding protein, histone-like, putative
MAVYFNEMERGNPGDEEAPKQWYAVLKSLGLVGQKEVAKQMSDETTLNPKEAEMALAQLEKILIRMLLDGKSVQLGDWGSFNLKCNSTPSATRKEVTAANIKKLNIRFTPGKTLKEAIAKAHLVPASTIQGGTK